MARKLRDRQDALACLEALDTSGMTLTPWARAHGVDARSLHCWRLNLGGRRDTSRLVELVPESPASQPRARVWGSGSAYARFAASYSSMECNFKNAAAARLAKTSDSQRS